MHAPPGQPDVVAEAAAALLADVDAYASQSAAAARLGDLARQGADLGAAREALLYAIDHATQVDLLRAAATALARHLVAARDGEGLRDALARRHGDWVGQALVGLAQDGVDVLPLLPGCWAAADEDAGADLPLQVAAAVVRARPKRFDAVIGLLAAGPEGAVLDLLERVVRAGRPEIEPRHLEAAAPALGAPAALRERFVALLVVRGGAPLDLAPVRPLVESVIAAPASRRGAHALTIAARAIAAWDLIDRLLAQEDPAARAEVCRALAAPSPGRRRDGTKATARLARALYDPAAAVAEAAAQGLLDAHRAGRRRPAATVRAEVERRGGASAAPAAARELLFAMGALPGDPPCRICAALPRDSQWSHELSRPQAVALLEGVDGWLRCPLCRAIYAQSYDEEWDITTCFRSWTLRRLPPTEAAARLEGAIGEAARAELPARLAEHEARLDHPLASQRREAAWALAEAAIASADWAKLGALLVHAEDEVRAEAARTLDAALAAHAALAPPEPVLRAGLDDRQPEVRRLASRRIARAALREGAMERVAALLAGSDAAVLVGAVEAIAAGSWADPRASADLRALAERLVELEAHPARDVRAGARRALAGAPLPPGALARRVDGALALLGGADPDGQNDGLDAIAEVGAAGGSLDRALPRVIEALADPSTTWHAAAVIERSAGATPTDLGPAVLPLARLLARRDLVGAASPDATLLALARAGGDVRAALPAVVAALPGARRGKRQALFPLLEAIAATGGDLAAHLDALVAAHRRLEGYQNEKLGRLVAKAALRAGRSSAIDALAATGDRDLLWGLCEVAKQEATAEAPPLGARALLDALAAALARALGARGQGLRERAVAALRALVERGHLEPAALRALVEGAPPSAERDKLLALTS